ncbi:hypothetical protein ANCCEY_08313 [Ancylostoma ceylanicum]|uniref:Uncharacterized protein n=1 Tax=Ancylostoma ceylanicum TaxID=53326 RepID=A0A0D6LY97_9BILA|nr:hypothetical protein ANCCEY_08313 [Ancylostoma ceylanicum]
MPERRSLLQMTEDDDLQLYKAHERIRALNRELLMQDDASAQINALRKKIAETKERAQGIVTMANKRLAYLTGMWKESSESEPFKSSVSDVNTASRTTGTLGPTAAEGNEYDVSSTSAFIYPHAVFARAVTALDAISTSTRQFGDCKKESSRLASELRGFLANMQKKSEKCADQSVSTSSQPVSQGKKGITAFEVASAVSGSATSTSKACEPGGTPMIVPKKTTSSRSDVDTSKTKAGLSTKSGLAEQLPGLQQKAEIPEATRKPVEVRTAVSSPAKATPSKKAPETQKSDTVTQLPTSRASSVPAPVQKTSETPKIDTVSQLTNTSKASTSASVN